MESLEEIEQFARYRSGLCAHAAKTVQAPERQIAWERMTSLWQNFVRALPSMTLAEAQTEVRRLQEIERIARVSDTLH